MAHRKGGAMVCLTYKKSSLLTRETCVKPTMSRHILSITLAVTQMKVWRNTPSYVAVGVKTWFNTNGGPSGNIYRN